MIMVGRHYKRIIIPSPLRGPSCSVSSLLLLRGITKSFRGYGEGFTEEEFE
jgi:hypothetical protein